MLLHTIYCILVVIDLFIVYIISNKKLFNIYYISIVCFIFICYINIKKYNIKNNFNIINYIFNISLYIVYY